MVALRTWSYMYKMFYSKDKDGPSEVLAQHPVTKPKLVAAQMTIFMYELLQSNKFCPSGLTRCLQDPTQCLWMKLEFQQVRSSSSPKKSKKFRRQQKTEMYDDGQKFWFGLFCLILFYGAYDMWRHAVSQSTQMTGILIRLFNGAFRKQRTGIAKWTMTSRI